MPAASTAEPRAGSIGAERRLTWRGSCTTNMSMKVLPIGEARRRLPELVRKIAEGHAPVAIGRRGRSEAVLAPPESVAAPVRRRPLQGLMKIVGTPDDLERGRAELRRDIERSLARTAVTLVESARSRRGRARR